MNINGRGRGVLQDALLGAAAGAAAIWVMDRFDWFAFEHEDEAARRRTQAVRPGGMDPAHVLADRLAARTGLDFGPKQQNPAGLAIHYSFGMVPGALYGVLRRRHPSIAAGHGALFGMGMFLLEDEILNPALGLARGPAACPWQDHARSVVAHLIIGVILETVLRVTDERRARAR